MASSSSAWPTTPQMHSVKPINDCLVIIGVNNPNGIALASGENLHFDIPQQYDQMILHSIILYHRKDQANFTKFKVEHIEDGDPIEYDLEGAYTLVSVLDSSTSKWVAYQDPDFKKSYQGKFAEVRPANNPEIENLHNWQHFVRATPSRVQVKNVSSQAHISAIVQFHKLQVLFWPKNVQLFTKMIFTAGTEFVNFKNRLLPKYGGGPLRFPSKHSIPNNMLYPDAWRIHANDELVLDKELAQGHCLIFVEVCCGDTDYDANDPTKSKKNKDGHYGILGWAKMNVYLQHGASSEKIIFLQNANVPPNGVLAGGCNSVINNTVLQKNSRLIIQSCYHDSWIMGIKMHYK